MDGTPAGWYDDPEQPGQKRWWDGSSWTEQRSSAGETPAAPPPTAAPTTGPTAPPPGAPVPPPPGAPGGPAAPPAKSSRKGLWIVLGVIAAVVVLAIVAVVVIAVVGGDDATDVVEENLPKALEENFSSQGLNVTVPKVDCDSISNDEGPFTTKCAITIDGLSQPLDATVLGDIDGRTVNVESVNSDKNVINEELAAKQAQPSIDEIDPTVSITSCTLSAPVVVVEDGMTFTCDTDSDETVTFEVQDGSLVITDVA